MAHSQVNLAALPAVYTGKKTVASAGTAVALASPQPVSSLTVKALKSNTGLVYVGSQTSAAAATGFQLDKSESVSLDVADLSTVYIDAAVNGEGVSYLAIGGAA